MENFEHDEVLELMAELEEAGLLDTMDFDEIWEYLACVQ